METTTGYNLTFVMRDGTEHKLTCPSLEHAFAQLRARGIAATDCWRWKGESDRRTIGGMGPAMMQAIGYESTLTGEIP